MWQVEYELNRRNALTGITESIILVTTDYDLVAFSNGPQVCAVARHAIYRHLARARQAPILKFREFRNFCPPSLSTKENTQLSKSAIAYQLAAAVGLRASMGTELSGGGAGVARPTAEQHCAIPP
jgi:hypothetical protein